MKAAHGHEQNTEFLAVLISPGLNLCAYIKRDALDNRRKLIKQNVRSGGGFKCNLN